MDEKEYEAGRARALRVLLSRYPLALAEDAVQAAALYFLEHDYPRVTPSLFTQRALQRAAHINEAAYGSNRPNAKARRVVYVGGAVELATFGPGSPVCMSDDDENA
jgi:hypothetical protein